MQSFTLTRKCKDIQLRMIVNVETTTSGITTVAFIGLIKFTKTISPALILHRWRANQFLFVYAIQLAKQQQSELAVSIT